MKTEFQAWYEEEGLPLGMTVAEFEVYNFMPKYSVYPEAAQASDFSQRGFFMYRNATPEERQQMATRGGRPRSAASLEERREARRKYLRDWHVKNRRKTS